MRNVANTKIVFLLKERFDLWQVPKWFVSRLESEFPRVEVCLRFERWQDVLPDAEIAIGWALSAEQLKAAQKLRWFHSITAATDQFDTAALARKGVQLTSAGRVHATVVAEHAIALVMALAKRLPSAMEYQRARKWAMEKLWDEVPRPRDIAGSVITIVGLGAIGSEIAKRANALGMYVIGVRAHPSRGKELAHEVLSPRELDGAIERSDFVVIAAPLSNETYMLFDKRRLKLFKPGAYLVNVSRGGIVDEAALDEALRKHTLAGAALDVFEAEPLSRASKLWDAPGMIITPHSAFLSEHTWDRHYDDFSERLRRFLAERAAAS